DWIRQRRKTDSNRWSLSRIGPFWASVPKRRRPAGCLDQPCSRSPPGSVGGPKMNGRRSSPGAILAAKTLRSTTAALCFSFWLVKNEGEGLVITERSSAKSRQRGRCREGGWRERRRGSIRGGSDGVGKAQPVSWQR